jgi:hypothetical protein
MKLTISKLAMKAALIIVASLPSLFRPHWRRQQGDGWDLEIVERKSGAHDFSVPPRRT